MIKFDYLVVGAGLFGSTFAYEMNKRGKKCLVIDNRDHIGGNCYTELKDFINIHKYGPHIFHTNDENLWNWINHFTKFHNYKHSPKVKHGDKVYSFPINLMTLNQLWGVTTPEEAQKKLDSVKLEIKEPKNLEEWVLSQVGQEIYDTFVKDYTKKQWGKDPKDLPISIIKRLPIRTTFEDNYYFDRFQGIPVEGYTKIFEKLLLGIEVRLGRDYFKDRDYYNAKCKKLVYTGKIDEFYDYKFGQLEYRTLDFQHEKLDVEDYQGCSQVNFTDLEHNFTRITEHKHFENSKSEVTWISKEFPRNAKKEDIPYYPISDNKNILMYNQYKKLADLESNVIFGGRLAEYKYYDMHQVIASALSKVKKELDNDK